MMSRRVIALSLFVLCIALSSAWSRPMTSAEAENAVKGWITAESKPLGSLLGKQVGWTNEYCDANNTCIYYVVYLEPSGFVIVAADDLVEPIVGFVSGYAYFDPSPQNTLGAIVSRDMPYRVGMARKLASEDAMNASRVCQSAGAMALKNSAYNARAKWGRLSQTSAAGHISSTSGISDLRVAPLVTSTWGQASVYGNYCYNYFTPNHYYDGCVATAMAQCLRYWQWPVSGVGTSSFRIYVSGAAQNATTRGGDDLGGPYNWNLMVASPGQYITSSQRQAIGALCYDAGVASHMQYGASGSGAYMTDAKSALLATFRYSNAVIGGNGYNNIGGGLDGMIMPNLDSGNPVLLGVWQSPSGAGHAIVADGYGYNSATLYYHLNMGWDGYEDAWYNLPNIDDSEYAFNVVDTCIYNIYKAGSGEIISGRITMDANIPVAGVLVTAAGSEGTFAALSNSNGIYAVTHVPSSGTYTVTASSPGMVFDAGQSVAIGHSADGASASGSRAGINFETASSLPAACSAPAAIYYPSSSTTGKYTVSWANSIAATAYQLMRSVDAGITWQQVCITTDTSYSEIVGLGTWRYAVLALNPGGASAWRTGSGDCVVTTTITTPAMPASISYPSSSSTGVYTVSWAASTGATSYSLERSSNGGKNWTLVYSGAATSYSEAVTSGSYRYCVRAINSAGSSSPRTGTSDCVVKIPPTVPATIAYPSSSSTGKYTISWSTVTGATSYRLERSCDGQKTWSLLCDKAVTIYADSVAAGTYYYHVRAENACGDSAYRTASVPCTVVIKKK
jgi:hypothetical protein